MIGISLATWLMTCKTGFFLLAMLVIYEKYYVRFTNALQAQTCVSDFPHWFNYKVGSCCPLQVLGMSGEKHNKKFIEQKYLPS